METEGLLEQARADPNLKKACYATNNIYAYYWDIGDKKGVEQELRIYNFVPTYEKWCLYCKKKGVSKHCSRCRTIYFCSDQCQRAAWPVHKKHCGRNQFSICSLCAAAPVTVTCSNCPVGWCSISCKEKIYSAHIDYDCTTFARLFPK